LSLLSLSDPLLPPSLGLSLAINAAIIVLSKAGDRFGSGSGLVLGRESVPKQHVQIQKRHKKEGEAEGRREEIKEIGEMGRRNHKNICNVDHNKPYPRGLLFSIFAFSGPFKAESQKEAGKRGERVDQQTAMKRRAHVDRGHSNEQAMKRRVRAMYGISRGRKFLASDRNIGSLFKVCFAQNIFK